MVATAAAEVPRRRALGAQNGPHPIGGRGNFDSRREVEANGIGQAFADPLAALGQQLVGTAQFLAVIAQHQAALVDQAIRADVAVVARFEAAGVIVLAAVDGDVLDAFA